MLRCSGVEASYGRVQILFGVDLAVERGEIVALLGTNGAGKSTLLRCVSGLMDVDNGFVEFDGQEIGRGGPQALAGRGVALMPGGRGVFPGLSVEENLRLSAWMLRTKTAVRSEARKRMLEKFPVLATRLSQRAGSLSGGEQQMLSLAMALMVTPELLLIDELSLGLSPSVVGHLLDVLRTLHEGGTTIVLVEQSVNVALEIAQRAVFMEKGEVRFTGPVADLLGRDDLLRSVFIEGSSQRNTLRLSPESVGPSELQTQSENNQQVALRCVDVSKHFGGLCAVNAVDVSIGVGEVVGLVGHNGAGKTTLMDLISGFQSLDEGAIVLGAMDIGGMSPHQRALSGLGRTFQEARLFPSLSVKETLCVALERYLESRSLIAAGFHLPASIDSEYEAAMRADELIELMGLGQVQEKLVGELSTGTRRILELACVMAQEPRILLLDEPSAGVAQRETEAMGPLLLRVQAEVGCSMLIIEHDMPLLSSVCDRLIALELGEVIAEGVPRDVLSHPRVISSYLGSDHVSINRSGPI
jgi:branched-chain amino acid transport system ATP-binding protein